MKMKHLLLFLLCLALCGAARAAGSGQLPPKAVKISGITYKVADGRPLSLDLYLPDTARGAGVPLLVFIHGGSWMHGSADEVQKGFQFQLLHQLLQNGYAVASVNYRLVSDEGRPRYPGPLSDCKDAVKWLKKSAALYRLDTTRFAISGTSAGAHLAMMTAYAPDALAPGDVSLSGFSSGVNCCIDIYGPTDLKQMFHPTLNPLAVGLARLVLGKDLIRERNVLLEAFTGESAAHPYRRRKACQRFSPCSYTVRAVPTAIFHGNRDRLVPLGQSKKLARKLRKRHILCQLHVVEGQDHAFPTLTEAEGARIAEKIHQFLLLHNQ